MASVKDCKALGEEIVRKVNPDFRVNWTTEHCCPRYTWDGHTLTGQGIPLETLHDVAHLVVAPPERRTLPEFGLGPDPGNPRSKAARTVSTIEVDQEESRACDLHVALAAYAGGWKAARYVMDYLGIEKVPTPQALEMFEGNRYLPGDLVAAANAVFAPHVGKFLWEVVDDEEV